MTEQRQTETEPVGGDTEEERADETNGVGDETRGETGQDKRDLSWHLDRIWQEIKDLSKQVEQETRRGGRIARLKFEVRGLRQDLEAEAARVGMMVYEAQMERGKRPTLSHIEGYDAAIERMAGLRQSIAAREEEIAELRHQEDAGEAD